MSEKTQYQIVIVGATLIGSIVAVGVGQVLGFTNEKDFSEVWLMIMTVTIMTRVYGRD